MNRTKCINLLFLITVLVYLGFSFLYSALNSFCGIDIFGGKYSLQLIISQLVLVLPCLCYLIFVRKDFAVLRFKKIKVLDLLLCVILYICINPLLNFLNIVSQLYSTNLISEIMFSASDEMPFLLGLLLIAIVPALFEESVYRGVFYNTYREKHSFGAVVMCGLIFGLMHGNLNQFTYAFVLGMFFALVVEATDSLWSTVTIHFLVNGSSVAIIYILPRALGYLQNLYNSAAAEGDTQTMDMLTELLGTNDFTMDAILGTAAEAMTKTQILQTAGAYLIPAVIGTTIAFFVYRLVAKRNGRWEIICSMFGKKNNAVNVPNAVQNEYSSAETSTGEIISENVSIEELTTEAVPTEECSSEAISAEECSLEKVSAEDTSVGVGPVNIPAQRKERLITWEFVVAAVIMFSLMILSEIQL